MNGKKKIGLCCRNGDGKTTFMQSSADVMDNPMGIDYLFDGRKDREPEPLSEEDAIRFDLIAEKETTSFRPMTEKQGVTDWFAMRQFSAVGFTGTRILGEALPNLYQV